MTRPKLTREEKQELGRWTININVRVVLDKDTHEPVEGSEAWGIDIMRGSEFFGGYGGFESLKDALKLALDRDYRGQVSPLGYNKPIPPRQVMLCISAKYLYKHDEFREALSDLLTQEVN